MNYLITLEQMKLVSFVKKMWLPPDSYSNAVIPLKIKLTTFFSHIDNLNSIDT